MTLFDIKRFSEIRDREWSRNTLRPPLNPKEIFLDIRYYWNVYKYHKWRFQKRLKFIFLRFLQRFSYNLGWILMGLKRRRPNSI